MGFVPAEQERTSSPPVVPVAPLSAGADPVTTRTRPLIAPELFAVERGLEAADPYVRRFWTAIIGPGAVTDLLRLIRAAEKATSIRRPIYLFELFRYRLAGLENGKVLVPSRIPVVPRHLRSEMPPFLRREHAAWLYRNVG